MMLIGDLFKNREAHLYPSADEIVAREAVIARRDYPGAKNDIEALAFKVQTLRAAYERARPKK